MGDKIGDFYAKFIMTDTDYQAHTGDGHGAATVTKPKSYTPPSKPSPYQQMVLDYDTERLQKGATVQQVQSMLDDMREKLAQQILDDITLLIDEALSR